MKYAFYILLCLIQLFIGCQSKERKQQNDQTPTSKTLTIGVLPTIDCLPVYIALQAELFKHQELDVILCPFKSQMDLDTALMGGSVKMGFTDIIRLQKLADDGYRLIPYAATSAHWQLISNRSSRINTLKQLDDKMIAMTRFSATALLSDIVTDSVKLKEDRVYKVQINDISLRLLMLLNNEMDAMWLPEPQATVARLHKHPLLYDTRKQDDRLGVIAIQPNMQEGAQTQLLKQFATAYNMAIDSIKRFGVRHYLPLIESYCMIRPSQADSIDNNYPFFHLDSLREKDINKANIWKKNETARNNRKGL